MSEPAQSLRGNVWPLQEEAIVGWRIAAFAEQTWTPGCFHCGETAEAELNYQAATDWWHSHREHCLARSEGQP